GTTRDATHTDDTRHEVLRYLYRNCAQDRAVIILGSPLADKKDANGKTVYGADGKPVQVPVGWGWGGSEPSPGGHAVGEGSGPAGGHIVIIYSFNRATKLFTVLGPSYSEKKTATRDQVLAFIENKGAGLSNMLPVPLDTVRSWMPGGSGGGGASLTS